MHKQTEVLVIGTGIAGLFSAIHIAAYAPVILVTKKSKTESNTNYAQGGIASVFGSGDTFENHINDTLTAGAGLCNRNMVEILVKEGPGRIQELMDIGVRFTTEGDALHLAREGGHSCNRIVHAKDLTGREVERALVECAAATPGLTIIENALAIDLITEHNLEKLRSNPINSRHCWGAYVLDNDSGKVITITARATVLATGGLGQVYLHTTNPPIATGDGYAMGYRAGVKCANMEFIQFHPTSLYEPAGASGQAFLISEALRGFGAVLRTVDGIRFMGNYDSRLELAPRDIVARAIDSELKKRGEDYVLLDVTHRAKSEIIDHFPNIYRGCLERGVDITSQPIPVVPAAHYACGGIIIDEYARTSLTGLYAVGEVSMSGVHGANRLASNSLLEAIVFARRAAINISEFLQNAPVLPIAIPDWDDSGTLSADEQILITHSARELKMLMGDYVGIVRSGLRLAAAARRVHNLYEEVEAYYKKTKVSSGLLELRNLVTCAHMIIKSAALRKESRGLHFTLDYPTLAASAADTIIQNLFQKS